MTRSSKHAPWLVVERLEDRTAPALFGPIDNAVNAGLAPIFVAVADFNSDGKQDLAVAAAADNNVTVLLGSGGGGFSPGVSFPTGNEPQSVVVGDFNGDGKPDLAVAATINVVVLLGNGSGGFSPAAGSPVAAGVRANSMAVGDFNGDGKKDLAIVDASNANVTVLLGNGLGGFSPTAGSPVTVGSSPQYVAVGDFNGDGKQDLAIANGGSNNVTVLLGNGGGNFSPAAGSPIAVGVNPTWVAVGDFNVDGKQDFAVPNSGGEDHSVTVLMGNGSGGFIPEAGSPVAVGVNPTSVAVGDFDGDGKQDLVVANTSDNNVTVLLGNGSGGFTPLAGSPFVTGINPRSVVVGDFNGDGKPDFAAANEGSSSNIVTIHLNHGVTTTVVSSAIQAVYGQSVTLTATVTGISGPTATGAVTFNNGATVLGSAALTNGSASISFPSNTPLAAGSYNVTATVTSDAFYASTSAPITQIVTPAPTTVSLLPPVAPLTGKAYTIAALVSGGNGPSPTGSVTFRDGTTIIGTANLSGGSASRSVIFSTGGVHNLTVSYGGDANNQASISPVTPVTTSGSAKRYAVGSGPGGKPEVKVFNTDGTLAYDFFAYATTFTGGVRVATADVNGDGVDDIITGAGPGGGPHVRVFDGTNLTELRSFFAVAPSFTGGVFVAGGDTDGDGKAEIITGTGGTGLNATVRVFSGATGAQLGNSLTPFGAFPSWVSVAAGDVNGDGKADIIVGAGQGGGPVVVVFNGANSAQVLGGFFAFAGTFTGGVYVAAGEISGDTRADIIAGAGAGGMPQVRAFDGSNFGNVLRDFLAYDPSFSGGVSVAVEDIDGDGRADIISGAGSNGGPHVRVYSGAVVGLELRSFFAFDPGFTGGVFVG